MKGHTLDIRNDCGTSAMQNCDNKAGVAEAVTTEMAGIW